MKIDFRAIPLYPNKYYDDFKLKNWLHASLEKHIEIAIKENSNQWKWMKQKQYKEYEKIYKIGLYSNPQHSFNCPDFWDIVNPKKQYASLKQHIEIAIKENMNTNKWSHKKQYKKLEKIYKIGLYSNPGIYFTNFWDKVNPKKQYASLEKHIEIAIKENSTLTKWINKYKEYEETYNVGLYSEPNGAFNCPDFWKIADTKKKYASLEKHIEIAIEENMNTNKWKKEYKEFEKTYNVGLYSEPNRAFNCPDFWDRVNPKKQYASLKQHIKIAIKENSNTNKWKKEYKEYKKTYNVGLYINPDRVFNYPNFWNIVRSRINEKKAA